LPDGAALERLRCLVGLLQQTERNAKALVRLLGSRHRLKHEIDGGARLKDAKEGFDMGFNMDDMRFVAYYRVSTQQQGQSGLGIKDQKKAVKGYIDSDKRRQPPPASYEEHESGKNNDRPKLKEALAACRLHKARLIVAKLDRLARNAHFLLTVQNEMGEQGVVFWDMPNINAEGPQGRFVIGIMAHVAELEAAMISKRTKDALAVKREALAKEGKKLGGNPENLRKSRNGVRVSIAVRQRKARQRRDDLAPIVEPMRKGGATLQAIASALNKQKVQAPRGGAWHPASVRRIIA
jgi:DNA invertase Pin-like site-specific DNA recombinase